MIFRKIVVSKKKIYSYLIGVFIGLFLVSFFLKKKNVSYDYLPNARVLKDIFSKPIVSKNDFKLLENSFLNDLKHGEVNFSKSQISQSIPCNSYWIDGPKATVIIDNCSDTAWVKEIIIR